LNSELLGKITNAGLKIESAPQCNAVTECLDVQVLAFDSIRRPVEVGNVVIQNGVIANLTIATNQYTPVGRGLLVFLDGDKLEYRLPFIITPYQPLPPVDNDKGKTKRRPCTEAEAIALFGSYEPDKYDYKTTFNGKTWEKCVKTEKQKRKGVCNGKVDQEVLVECNAKCGPLKSNATALSKCIGGYK